MVEISQDRAIIPSRTQPFLAKIKERYTLTAPGSVKETLHLVLDLEDSAIHYRAGDSIGIFPLNHADDVARIITRLGGATTPVTDRQGATWEFSEYLSRKANIARCSKKLFQFLLERQTNSEKRSGLEPLLAPESKDALKSYLNDRHAWDLLEEHSEVALTPQELVDHLAPLLPRLYSTASSPLAHPNEMHLTVTLTQYESNSQARRGVCSHFLCYDAPLENLSLPVYLQPTKDFLLPEDPSASIIMVGPGTGVAPFRAFMQERVAKGHRGDSWLFFGECNRAHDFYYEDYWTELETQGKLRLDTAFSRDQAHKIYVQDRLKESSRELFTWLESGAYFYVCGDAEHMAKAVDTVLHQIVTEEGGLDPDGAKQYVKNLRRQKRYLRDVY